MSQQILAMERDETISKLLNLTFGERGFSVSFCGDESELDDCLGSSDELAVVLLDLDQGDSRDLETLTTLQGRRQMQEIPIVLLSPCVNSELRNEALQRGAAAVVEKPVMIEELVELVDRLVCREGSAS